ncbi:FMN-binding negative transcriptional regulator [Teichococcus aestuarii]|uniref:FMN-binding negative transcriptional regulator n=1 Tax=Teichococcus aestuarii TaxID=568898 RepID=UPI00361E62E4
MYVPPAFRLEELPEIHAAMRAARLPSLVTATAERLMATPLPLLLAPEEGPFGTLYGHLARANPQWRTPPLGEAMVLFGGPEAYVTPNWYASKAEHHKVVPTWNYVAVHAHGRAEFFEDPARLHDVVARLTARHEGAAPRPGNWPTRRRPSCGRSCAASSGCGCPSPGWRASAR